MIPDDKVLDRKAKIKEGRHTFLSIYVFVYIYIIYKLTLQTTPHTAMNVLSVIDDDS